ncbi:unnamed protein product [Hydatigera taeniaeformis]|uniref:C-SKI_SMAD_bind domain-containing protein n=1 Tax=Hydatigena taeniaeformis TaxID=6205 RepID=A0A0R3WZQ3_HYDTA|nr:unnamed protein product [Hydatigera taeniaeformis]
MRESSGKEKMLSHSIHALLQPKGMEEPTLSIFHLFGEPLVCLLLNGEERLCLAQISSRLLRGYSYNEIHNRRVALGITCVQCSPRQLEMLRRVGAMPLSSRRCGTITKREAQRLVESFLQHLPAPPRLPENFVFEVEHHCGWGCSGLFVPTRYNSSRAKCVQCAFCHVFFSPNKFIFHCHSAAETGVQQQIVNYRHPDAANFNAWRRHLLLANPNPPDSLLFAWEDIKAMFNGGNRTKKVPLSLPLPTPFATTTTTTSTVATPVETVEEDPNESATFAACFAPPKRPTLLGVAPLIAPDVLMLKTHPNLPSLMGQHTSELSSYLWLSGTTSGEPMQSHCGSSGYSTSSGDVCGGACVNDSLSAWTAHLREYFEKVTQGIFLPPPPPPPPLPVPPLPPSPSMRLLHSECLKMSDRGSHELSDAQNGRSIRRRKSLLYRITDTITSFLPSLFESKDEAPSGNDNREVHYIESSAKRSRTSTVPDVSLRSVSSRLPRHLSISRLEGVQIPNVSSPVSVVVDVDLDAVDDRSEYSTGSRVSMSTSGVSSLFPRRHRNEHPFVKSQSRNYRSDSVGQGNSSNKNRGFIELWTDLEGCKQSTLNATHSAPKRMRMESTQSPLSSAFSSPFYRGRVAYGGASSLRCTPQSRNVFEHVAPLHYIMEDNEGESPNSSPSSSNAILSATAQRILQSLERHGSAIPSGSKVSSLVPIPFSPLSTPLRRSTTRYPSYMATYNRYKEFKRQFASQSPSPSVLPQFSVLRNRTEEHDSEAVTLEKGDTIGVTRPSAFEASSESSQTLKPTSIQSHGALTISERSKADMERHPSASYANFTKEGENIDEVGLQIPGTVSDACILAKPSTGAGLLSPNQQTKFVFSSPISLGSPMGSSAILPAVCEFAFSYPKPSFKRPAPVENSSFLPILMSPQQPMLAHPHPSKKVTALNFNLAFLAALPSDLDLWRCESCLMENSGRDGVCKSCHLPIPVPYTSKSNSIAATPDKPAFLVSSPSNGWECPTCMVKNKIEAPECVCCHTLKPSVKVVTDISKEKVTVAPTFNFGPPKSVSSTDTVCVAPTGDKGSLSGSAFNFGNPVTSTPNSPEVVKRASQSSLFSSKGWNCPTCLVKNDESLKDCPCCKTAKPMSNDSPASRVVGCGSISGFNFSNPNNVTPTAASFCFGNKSDQTTTPNFKFGDSAVHKNEVGVKFGNAGENKWECPSCMVKNSDVVGSCVCCQTNRPSLPLKSNPSVPNESDDKWVCSTCLAKNDASADLCLCCQTKKSKISNSVPAESEWTCVKCLAKNGVSVSKCVSCQAKNPEVYPHAGTQFGTSQHFSSPPVIVSTLKPSLNFGSQNSSAVSVSSFTTATSDTPSFSFSKPADVSNTPARVIEPSVTSIFSNLKNGGFNFGSSGGPSGFDFSAKKENVTPVVSATTSSFPSVSFNFGASPVTAPVFKFGEPKLSSGNTSGDTGSASESTVPMANDIYVTDSVMVRIHYLFDEVCVEFTNLMPLDRSGRGGVRGLQCQWIVWFAALKKHIGTLRGVYGMSEHMPACSVARNVERLLLAQVAWISVAESRTKCRLGIMNHAICHKQMMAICAAKHTSIDIDARIGPCLCLISW